MIITVTYSGRAFAIYTWIDENGVTHMSDMPRPDNSQEKEPPDSGPAEKAKLPDSYGQSLDVGHAPMTRKISKLATAPVASVVSSQNVQAVALQSQRQQPLQAGFTTTNGKHTQPPNPVITDLDHEPARNIPSGISPSTAQNKTAFTKLIAAFLSIFLFGLMLAYLYFSLCLFLIARKLNVSAAWVAWVPIFQVWTFLAAAGKPGWWVLLLLVPVVNLIIPAYLWICVAENLGREKWLGLLMLIPIVNLVYLGMLAFSDSGGSSNRTPVAT